MLSPDLFHQIFGIYTKLAQQSLELASLKGIVASSGNDIAIEILAIAHSKLDDAIGHVESLVPEQVVVVADVR